MVVSTLDEIKVSRSIKNLEATRRQKWMLLYMSSDFIELLVGLLDGRVELSSHIALQTSNDFSFTHSLCGATTHIGQGASLMMEAISLRSASDHRALVAGTRLFGFRMVESIRLSAISSWLAMPSG